MEIPPLEPLFFKYALKKALKKAGCAKVIKCLML